MRTFDPVELGILWDRLISITDEIVSTLVRTGFSTLVKEQGDLSVVLFDAQGNSLAQGSFSQPAFIGTAPLTMRHFLAKHPPETLRPGDVLITNDPWMGTGHLFDVTTMRPVFQGNRIVGFTLSVSHVPDIGGHGFGTVGMEVFEEGLQIPIMKLVEDGRVNEHLMEIIRGNVRTPDMTCGDLMAHISCHEVGARYLLEMMEEYRLDELSSLSHAIASQTEAAMRAEIRKIPDGCYSHRLTVEAVDGPVDLACTIDVDRDSIRLDFAGTGPAVRRGINVPLTYTRAFSLYTLKCLTIPNLPNNEGAARPLTVTAPENSILNALRPYPTGGRHIIGHCVPALIFGALAEALPDRVQAECGMTTQINCQGVHRNGQRFSTLFLAPGGFGALQGMDGWPALPGPANMICCAAEVWEAETSMTVVKKTLRPDSGGAGRFRGGLGQEIVLRNDTGYPLTILCMSGRNEYPPLGLAGGSAGAAREYFLDGKQINPKGRYIMEPGSTIRTLEPGGGGFGAPRERPREKLLEDLSLGRITREGAARDYGVSLNATSDRA